MSRWPLLLLLLASAAGGCKQRCIVVETSLLNRTTLPALLDVPEESPRATTVPLTNAFDLPDSTTINNPSGQPRYLTLAEAIALALEGGTVGIEDPLAPGQARNFLVNFTGAGIAGSDAIRVLALEPARVATDIEASLSRFDARWVSGINWVNTDDHIGTPLQSVETGGATGLTAIQNQAATATTGLFKPLATGGVAGVVFSNDYLFTNVPSPVNPEYRPRMTFLFEQPLLQGFGFEINQLRATHPGSTLANFTGSGPTEGILIVRSRFDQSRAEFGRLLNTLLWNVEAAYWNLYGAYWRLTARELGLRQAHEVWRRESALAQSGRTSRANSAQSRGQYEQFRSQRIAAVGQVLEAERQLRLLIGLPREDGTRLIPANAPLLAGYRPDWRTAVQEAMNERPELTLARAEVRVKQLSLINEKNRLLPDLRFTSSYEIQGLGSRLDGPGPDNALRSLASNKFQNAALGLRLEIPIGYREGNARVRAAYLELSRSLEVLRDQENKVASYLAFQYRQLAELQEQVRTAQARRQAYAEQLEVRFRESVEGRDVPLPFLLEAQRSWSDALASEYDFIVQYNNALAGFEFARGTIARAHNVQVAEAPPPGPVQRRAVENERERTQALVVRERAAPLTGPIDAQLPGMLKVPTDKAPTLPAVLEGMGAAEAGLVR
jgi:outer membrane protein TolC